MLPIANDQSAFPLMCGGDEFECIVGGVEGDEGGRTVVVFA